MKRSTIASLTVIIILLFATVIPACATTAVDGQSSADTSTSSRKVTIEDVAAGAADIYDLYGSDYVFSIPDAAQTYQFKYEGRWDGYEKGGGVFLTGCDYNMVTEKDVLTVPTEIEAVVDGEKVKLPVIGLGNGVFRNKKNLKIVKIPEGISSIGEEAFKNCTSLTTVYFPTTLESVGKNAFANCTSIVDVQITDIAKWCVIDFRSPLANPMRQYGAQLCVNGSPNLILPEGLLEIRDYCFTNCVNLRTIVLPKSLKIIGHGAFEFCSNLRQIEFGDGVEMIGNYAFANCPALELEALPRGLKELETGMFSGSNGIKAFHVTENIKTVCGDVFRDCSNLSEVYFHSEDTQITESAFGSIPTAVPSAKIIGYVGSTAEAFAKANALQFVDITTVEVPDISGTATGSAIKPTENTSDTSDTVDTDAPPQSDGESGSDTPMWRFVILGIGGIMFICGVIGVIIFAKTHKKHN